MKAKEEKHYSCSCGACPSGGFLQCLYVLLNIHIFIRDERILS